MNHAIDVAQSLLSGKMLRLGRVLAPLLLMGCGALFAAPPLPSKISACDALQNEYREALPQAQVCEPKSTKPCDALRPVALEDACRCEVSVNPERTQDLDKLLTQYKAMECPAKPLLCRRMCLQAGKVCAAGADQAPRCGEK